MKVKCIDKTGYVLSLKVGEVYTVLKDDGVMYTIMDEDYDEYAYPHDRFIVVDECHLKDTVKKHNNINQLLGENKVSTIYAGMTDEDINNYLLKVRNSCISKKKEVGWKYKVGDTNEGGTVRNRYINVDTGKMVYEIGDNRYRTIDKDLFESI